MLKRRNVQFLWIFLLKSEKHAITGLFLLPILKQSVFLSSSLLNPKHQTKCQSLTRRSNLRFFSVNSQTAMHTLILCAERACSGLPIFWGRGTRSVMQTDWASTGTSCSHAQRDRSLLRWSRIACKTWGSPRGDSVRHHLMSWIIHWNLVQNELVSFYALFEIHFLFDLILRTV